MLIKRLLLTFSIAATVLPAAAADIMVFDSTTVDPVFGGSNYWPWGDNRNSRYQLWFSQSSLNAYGGTLASITHFAVGDLDHLGTSSYVLNIYASTTPVGVAGLSAFSPDNNHGANKTLIFSGSVTSAAVMTIDVNDVFNYDHSGNLLIDYQFSSFSGVGDFYDGPTFQASLPGGVNPDFVRVTNHPEGMSIVQWGALRTQLAFVPEPSAASLIVLGTVLFGGRVMRRRQRRVG